MGVHFSTTGFKTLNCKLEAGAAKGHAHDRAEVVLELEAIQRKCRSQLPHKSVNLFCTDTYIDVFVWEFTFRQTGLNLEAGAAEGHAHDRTEVILELAAIQRKC